MKRTTHLYLTGGGPGAMAPLRRHLKAAVSELKGSTKAARKRPLVAYVGTASHDDAGFFAMIRPIAEGGAGATLKLAKLASAKASASAARGLLEDSDMVFVSGGDVEHGMEILHDRDMVRTMMSLAKGGKPMFGVSAGSLMLARDWVRFPGDDAARAELFPCLGIAPLHVDAHSEDDDWGELRVLVHLLHRRGDKAPTGHGLTRKGALRLAVDPAGTKMDAVGTPIPRIVVRRGKVVDGDPLGLPDGSPTLVDKRATKRR